MVEKVKNLNWALYSDISLILANITALLAIVFMTINTTSMETLNSVTYLLVMGLMVLVLLKLNHVASRK